MLLQNGLTHTTESASRLSTLFDRFFNDEFFAPVTAARSQVAVPLSLWEDEDNYHVEVDAPGMTEKDLDISVHNGELIIRGERRNERKGNGYDTRSYGRFEQRISLPTAAKADRVEAKLVNGVLSLTFPKGEEAKPRKIELRSE
jgi:HSP20 family protein